MFWLLLEKKIDPKSTSPKHKDETKKKTEFNTPLFNIDTYNL